MFRVSITQTPFTTDAANLYFKNITGEKYGSDCSFLSTLRALLSPRMKESENISLKFVSTSYSKRTIHDICIAYNLSCCKEQIIVHNLSSDSAGNKNNFDIIEASLESVYSGYHRLDKLRAFYRKSFRADCYINPELKCAVVFAENLDNKKMHYLQVSILAMLPWYFNPEAGISDDEMALIRSLRETNPDNYIQCLAKMAERYDFRSARIRRLLNGFEKRYEEIERESVKDEISRIDREIRELNASIGNCISIRNECCIRLLGLEASMAEDRDSEIMDYFLCSHNLVLEDIDKTYMYFAVKDYLEYFDSEMAERAVNNKNSFVYSYGFASHGGEWAEKAKRLMKEIFVSDNPRLRIRFCAAYRFNLNGSIQPRCGHDFSGFDFVGYMPNPHIDKYQCMGGYETVVNKLLVMHNYISALEQCIASCKSLNWCDSIVMREFMSQFWNGARCIELPDGTVVDPKQAVRWLEEQDKSESQNVPNENECVKTDAAASEESKEEEENEQAY